MTHSLVDQLRFAHSEVVRCLEGVSEDEARHHQGPMNCISWIVGHLANQEHHYWVVLAQGKNLAPGLNDLVGYGQPASTPALGEMWATWRTITAAAPELLAMIQDGFDAGQAEDLTEVCQHVPWLVVDDLGAERLTDWAAEVLFRVFNARYTARAHTLVVSNVRPEEVPEARLSSRFLDIAVCQVVPNGGEDYRQCGERIRTGR